MTEIDDARLAQLVGVRSSKTGYYARWRGTATDLERALAGWDDAERRADEMARRNDQLRRAREQLARVRQAEALSAERHRIARDLHDGVAQCLVGIGMHLEWCKRHTEPGRSRVRPAGGVQGTGPGGLGWVRSAVDELSGLEHPGTGLGQALRDLAADFRSARLLRVSVRVSGCQRQLPAAVEHSLFQICQEGLWNVVRHAQASQAWLSLGYGGGQVTAQRRRRRGGRSGRGRPLPVGVRCGGGRQARAAEHGRADGGTRRRHPGAAAARRRPADHGVHPVRVSGMTAAVRILVVDDHTIVRQGLRSILELEPDFTVVGEAATPDEAVAQAARLRPDVVLLDLKLSDAAPAEGLDVCAALRGQRADAAIVVLTTFLDERLLVGALRRGASGYALKDVDAVELARIIRAVHRGQSAFDSRSADLVVRSLTARAAPSAGVLSERELEVVRPVARGATNPQVARELYLSESTVKYHLRTAMRKLGARDRTELVYKAGELGLL